MAFLALVRHGQSQWNLENRFTGWMDVNLTAEGEAQARKAGQLLKASGVTFSQSFTSLQTRAIRTLWLALQEMDCCWLPEEKSWHLNERHYGALTGLDKAETVAKHGEEQVRIWRRSYDVPPPPQSQDDPFHPIHDPRYRQVPAGLLPNGESLAMTLARVLPYWGDAIAPRLHDGNVLISAHGNSLRAIIKHLFDLDEGAIMDVEVPTANPLLIELDAQLRPVSARYLDAERAQKLPAIG
ncbi:2,3-bisphosphoglycerate-dependent phosphoglycerate mutase [Candidatus Phycosocius bacilliformis]|uniref:2,3-bisphosphoglycerate-dependent phosphoglycerate mutase n=1 Tax=Candidatus Phycosocius bacilliformis TaxID=1445552 RepID=A0A2P2E7B5_9PROT|nr:2,3-diphosphoglycerate-dependent phosphoglycerate mutase [Candidatus Phycosocius bacilliformis]GBF56957.1 2,3-bisphosphoglycerate-dependent phosphoglycerate mutase [Candidatus Phycosocius bacilliformis]